MAETTPEQFRRGAYQGHAGREETQMTPPDKDEQDITQLAGECGAVVEGLYRYCRRKSPMHQPEIALFTALTVIGIVCGRIWEADIVKYKSPRGEIKEIPPTTTTDYLLIMAPTGAGKESVKSVIRDLLRAAKLDIPTPPLATGINAIHTAAQKNPRVTFITDEAGLNRQTTGTGKGDPNGKKTVETYQMDIYASRSTVTNPQLYATGKENPNLKRIWRNALSVVLLSTQETFAQALGSDDAHSGYLSRYVILNATRGREPVLGKTDLSPAEEEEADAETQKMIAPFLEWAQTHAGSPEYDTYAQLIPPSMAAAWRVLAGFGAIPAETGELQAIDHATYVHYPPRPQKGEMPPCPPHIRARPDPVRWAPAARSELMRIYAENEVYCRNHPDAKDLLTRKLQHVMIYAMRIALACDDRHADRFSPFAVLLLKKAKDALDAADKALKAAQEALNAESSSKTDQKKKTPSKATRDRLAAAIAAKEERQTKYLKAIVCVRDGIRMTYADHPTMITAKHVKTALKIIDFTLKSSLQHIADAIPPQTWIDAKDRVIQILRDQYKKNGEGIPKSRIERRLRTYHFGEKWQVLIDEMEYDDIIRYGEPAPNGGCMIYLTEYDPRS